MRILIFLEIAAAWMITAGIVLILGKAAVDGIVRTVEDKPRQVVVTEMDKRVYLDCLRRGIKDWESINLAVYEARARGEK
jgi:hypothetical protein